MMRYLKGFFGLYVLLAVPCIAYEQHRTQVATAAFADAVATFEEAAYVEEAFAESVLPEEIETAGIEPIIPKNNWEKSVLEKGPTIVAKWQETVEGLLSANESDLSKDLIAGIMLTESMGKPHAAHESGATGLLGIRPIVCRELKIKRCNLFDPHQNLALGVKYLERLQGKYGFEGEMLILAYNAGPTGARKISKKRTVADLEYVQRVRYAQTVIERLATPG